MSGAIDRGDIDPNYELLGEVTRSAQARGMAIADVRRDQERYANWEPAVDPMGPNRAQIAKALRKSETRLVECTSAFQAAVTAAVITRGGEGPSAAEIRRAIRGDLPAHWSAPGGDEGWVGDR